MHLFKFPLLFSKVGCILNSQLFRHMPSEIPDKQNAQIVKSVHHMCAPKVVKIGCFLTEIFKKGGRFGGHGVVEKCDDGGVMCWQFEGAISSGGRGVVHHLEVFHCEAPPHVHIPYYNAPCSTWKCSTARRHHTSSSRTTTHRARPSHSGLAGWSRAGKSSGPGPWEPR